jgi:hypothetical protein
MMAVRRVAPLLAESTHALADAAQIVNWSGEESDGGWNTRQTLAALLAALTALQSAVYQLAEYVDQARDS